MLLKHELTPRSFILLLVCCCGDSSGGASLGVAEELSVRPQMVWFGTVAVGSIRTATVSVVNPGVVRFRLTDITTSSTSTSAFRYALDTLDYVEGRDQATVTVAFAPPEPGRYGETIQISTRGPRNRLNPPADPQPLTVGGEAHGP